MLRSMRVAGETDARSLAEESEEIGGVGGILRGTFRIDICLERNMHHENNQFVGRDFFQQIGDEGELPFADAPDVFSFAY